MSENTSCDISLSFMLNVTDDWPPLELESLPFSIVSGNYKLIVPPIFVKNLSVNDILHIEYEQNSLLVTSWRHIFKSNRTTIWLLRLQATILIDKVLSRLRLLGCHTVRFENFGCYSIDVPESIKLGDVETELAVLDEEFVAIAYPSLRHEN